MVQIMLYSMMMAMGFIFLQMSHPLALGFVLLIQTLFICLFTGILTQTFWFSYILFLVFLGGLLVLFIYVTSLASNEMFSMSLKMFIFSMMIILITMIIMKIISLMNNEMINNLEMQEMTMKNIFNKENIINISKLYNYPTNLITILLIIYLLITLIAIVKITNIFYGPLRPMMN
uniref:NADH-ubiquinone oxidoreductase chain 6 n=1 Tax=Lonchoptera multiseta TaxID=2321081 RepID=A0A5H2PEL9_9MUSC|nr:NADH dehydrogenase subunit 6 [Lonchoptera multiseta]